jgi:hypothetical protein
LDEALPAGAQAVNVGVFGFDFVESGPSLYLSDDVSFTVGP